MLNQANQEVVQILGMFTLGLYDQADKAISSLESKTTSADDQFFLTVLAKELQVHRLQDEMAPPEESLPQWQNILNSLADYQRTNDGAISPWVWKSERMKIELNLRSVRYSASVETLAERVHAAEVFHRCYMDSGKDDVLSLGRMVSVLITLREFGVARKALRELMAHARLTFLPYYYGGVLRFTEGDYREALEYYGKVEQRMPGADREPRILFDKCLCNYYLGDLSRALELATEGMTLFPDFKGFANNKAFIKLRELMRADEGRVWKDGVQAAEILKEFVDSIKEPGWAGTPHFNIALMIFHADREKHMEQALAALKGRRDYTAPTAVVQAFERARNALNKDRDYLHELAAHYYLARVNGGYKEDPRRLVLDALIWDADNFVTEKASGLGRQNALLRSNKELAKPFDHSHLAILKRWCHCPDSTANRPIPVGGGYFVRWRGHGIVVNPGPQWLYNFAQRGYSIDEVDAIVVTSAKLECHQDLPRLLRLLMEARAGGTRAAPVDLFLHPEMVERHPFLLSGETRSFAHPQMITPGKDLPLASGGVVRSMSPCNGCGDARMCEGHPMGVLLELGEGDGKLGIGFLADYCAKPELLTFMGESDIVVISLGCMTFRDFLSGEVGQHLNKALTTIRDNEPELLPSLGFARHELHAPDMILEEDRRGYRRWCGIDGVAALWGTAGRTRILVLSDLPVEMGDCRQKIARVLNGIVDRDEQMHPKVLTGDTGLKVNIPECEVVCEFENSPVPTDSIDEECLEGYRLGPVKHFRVSHRDDKSIVEFLASGD